MFTEFIESCTGCTVACEQCIQGCFAEGKAFSCYRYCADCSGLGSLAVKMTSSKSPFTHDILQLLAEACDACAVECEKHALTHHHCKICAEACRRNSRICRQMISQVWD